MSSSRSTIIYCIYRLCHLLSLSLSLDRHNLRLLRLCHQRQTLLPLILDLLDYSTVNILLLILSNSKQRIWFKKHQTSELVHNLTKKLFELYRQKQCSIHSIFKITAILHVHCNAKQLSKN
ncbi:unnamed protein product [Rotaria sp. Silwood2]|nr:unnamed protein product [Rotaria sp. Silwood2]